MRNVNTAVAAQHTTHYWKSSYTVDVLRNGDPEWK